VNRGGAWQYCEHAKVLPEANIQAEFYHCCRQLGINCVLEVSTDFGRPDVLILDESSTHIVAVIECKSGRPVNMNGWQATRYGRIGFPVIGLHLMMDAEPLAQRLKTATFSNRVELKSVNSGTFRSYPRRKRITQRTKQEFEMDELRHHLSQ